MTRFVAGSTLPAPPAYDQNTILLPDGNVDIDHKSDCGETCLAAVLNVHTTFELTPGCIREALKPPRLLGYTTASDLTGFLNAFGVPSWSTTPNAADAWNALGELRHHGFYKIMLGEWLEFPAEHWVLAYERTSTGVWVMDPWQGIRRLILEADFRERFSRVVVTCRLVS